jgi:hypothetical protein
MVERLPVEGIGSCTSLAGYDAVSSMRASMRASGHVSHRPIVIAAGRGATGTSALSALLTEAFGIARRSNLAADVGQLSPAQLLGTDWPAMVDGVDLLADEPIGDVFPYLLAAFPHAKVIHTVREPSQWVGHRVHEPKPFAAYYSALRDAIPSSGYFGGDPLASPDGQRHATAKADLVISPADKAGEGARAAVTLLYTAHNAFVRCITPRAHYLPLNVFAGELCDEGLLPRLSHLLNRTAKLPLDYRVPGCRKRCGRPTAHGGTPEDPDALALWGIPLAGRVLMRNRSEDNCDVLV